MSTTDASKEKRIAVTLTPEQQQRLRVAAAEMGLSAGLVSRAAITYVLDHLDRDDVKAAIAEVKDADRARRREVGRKVMNDRWGNRPDDKEKSP